MRGLIGQVNAVFTEALKKAFPHIEVAASISVCANTKMGDYQCNNAMAVFKMLKEAGAAPSASPAPSNPRAVAQAIVDNLPSTGMFAKTEVAGAGFINVFLNRDFISQQLVDVVRNGVTLPPLERKKKAIVDFSSPNIAKEMHVGHLRSTIIGDTIARVLEFVGYEVQRINHVGDWGTQFGMLIAFLKLNFPDFLSNPPAIADLQSFYKQAKKKFDEDPEFKTASHQEVRKLQAGDEDNRKAWEMICEVSRREFNRIYARLDIKLEEKGESFYNPLLPPTLAEMESKGLLKEDNGATCFFSEKFAYPLIVRKSDGAYTYDSTDCAAIRYRLEEEKADWAVYVVDAGQASHFDLVFEAAKQAQWYQPERNRVDHVGFGVVLGEDRKKFKTRSGDTVRLVDLLDEARDRCLAILKERSVSAEEAGSSSAPVLSEEEMLHAAEAIGYGAVKYADLKNHRTSDYIFSFDKMLDLKGNTAVYMLYSHARIASIGRKAGVDLEDLKRRTETIRLDHTSEMALACHLLRFPDVIDLVLQDLLPNRICEYVYELAGKFNDFFRDCRVIGDENQDSRLLLAEASAMVMRACFQLLGITALYRI